MADLTKDHWVITPVALSEVINKKRKELNKSPIDHATMMTHLVLKSNVTNPGLFDFEAPKLMMDAGGVRVMEGLLDDQFGLRMEKKLSRHCTLISTKTETAKLSSSTLQAPPQVTPHKSGIMSKLSRIFGR